MSAPLDRTPDAAEWDERYGDVDQVWSGDPNGALVAETTGLTPGRALDVGCGEGADAVWLARRGWRVTAVDVSGVALRRARRHAEDAGVEVRWLHAGLLEAGLPAGAFDLVSAQYAVLRRTATRHAERTLTGLVAPGGTLLVVHHDLAADPDPDDGHAHGRGHGHVDGHVDGHGADGGADRDGARPGGFDPDEYVMPADVAAVLDDGWQVDVDELRPRAVRGGGGAHHVRDVVLRARRR